MVSFNDYIIDGKKLLSNIRKIKRYIGRQTKICAVVKADAYGLGVKNVCPLIQDEVDYFAVVNVKEAMEIRLINSEKPILILGASNLECINWCARNNVMVSVSTLEELDYIDKYCKGVVGIHLKINSGMNRYGIKSITKLRQMLRKIKKSDKIRIVGVYTHFATKDENLEFIDVQYDFFEKMVAEIKNPNLIVHCANSFVSTTDKMKVCNMVRVGLSMYSSHYNRLKIENVLTIRARVVAINTLRKGESVGYDRTYIARKTERIAVVSMGYADGFFRSLGNNFNVIVNGQLVPVVGNVCMDCFMINISQVKNVFVGSDVTILGEDCEKILRLEDYAEKLKLSTYEVLVNFKRHRTNEIVKIE